MEFYFDILTNENFLYYAAKHYHNPHCTGIDEFLDDVKKFKHIKKLLSRYENGRSVNVRLLLNHIITVYNVFEIEAANSMLFHKIDKKYWNIIKTFLVFLKFLKEDEHVEIPLHQRTINELRKI